MVQFAYYVYYRVASGGDALARNRVRAAQADIAAATGSRARLLVERDEPHLWMEVYEDITDADSFERTLAAAVEHYGLAQLARPGTARNVECFTEPECA